MRRTARIKEKDYRRPSHTRRFTIAMLLWVCICGLVLSSCQAQTAGQPQMQRPDAPSVSSTIERDAAGDSPDDPGPLATDLSPALRRNAIERAVRKVADWQLGHSQSKFNQQWTFAALYDGLLAASKLTGDVRYQDAVVQAANGWGWKLTEDRFPHADDMALGQAYLDLYLERREPLRIAGTKAILDLLIVRPDDPAKLLWWWCDALFMAPPVLARMSMATGDRRYLDYMDHEWWLTSASLYDPQEHLFFRDSRYFTKREQNGEKIFWARGNGWVMGAFAKVLEGMPADYPSRQKYIAQYREMAARVASLQGKDGLWRSGLLDPAAYDLPEVSGSAFFTYSLAWGINRGLLDRGKYEPVVQRAWAGMLMHIYADGRLGSIQPIDAQPGAFKPSSSYVYGVGGFLLAASEVKKLASK
jgi:unsaturated rhamnogalacturonyl hydrolase